MTRSSTFHRSLGNLLIAMTGRSFMTHRATMLARAYMLNLFLKSRRILMISMTFARLDFRQMARLDDGVLIFLKDSQGASA